MNPNYQIIQSFIENLKAQDISCNILILGSMALIEAGLPMKKKPQDIDLALGFDLDKYYDRAKGILSSLHHSRKSISDHDYPSKSQNQFKIVWRGVVMDIWIYKEKEFQKLLEECNYFCKYNYYRFADIKSTLEAKLKYNREKDLEDLIGIINELISLVGNRLIEKKDLPEIG